MGVIEKNTEETVQKKLCGASQTKVNACDQMTKPTLYPEGDQRRLDLYYKTNEHHEPPSLLWQRLWDKDWIFIPWFHLTFRL